MKRMKIKEVMIIIILLAVQNGFSADRVYTADEVSNTVSVVDPLKEELKGVIALGEFRPKTYKSLVSTPTQINVHGISISPDKKSLIAVSNITNSVVFIDPQGAKPKRVVYVGRSPHSAEFTPEGGEVWVTNRGEENISILNSKTLKEIKRLKTVKAPSFVIFLKSKKLAFVCSAASNRLQVFNYKSKKLIKEIELNNIFSPVMALSPDQKQIWLVQKDISKVARISTQDLKIIDSFETGSYTQHTQFLVKDGKQFGLATVGGEGVLKVYSYDKNNVKLIKTIKVDGVPHGVWSSGHGDKIFVGLEHADKLVVIHTDTFEVSKEIPIGKSPQAILYVSDSVDEKKDHEANLKPLLVKAETKAIAVKATNPLNTLMSGSVALRADNFIDYITFQIFNLDKESEIKVLITDSKEEFSKIDKKDLTTIGYLACQRLGTCISESSLPMSENLRKMFNLKNGQIFFVNNDTNEVVLKN